MRFFHSKSLWSRLYGLSLSVAILITSPLLALAGWLTLNAYLDYSQFIGTVSPGKMTPKFTSEMLHWFAHDSLRRSYHRLTAGDMPVDKIIDEFQLSIAPESLVELNSNLPTSGKTHEFRAYLNHDGKTNTVKARYTGDNYWHWLFTQKSWRIKTKKTKLIEGVRKFNLKNPRTLVTFNEVIAMDLARDLGLIAPRMKPVRFIQNNLYMGIYLFGDKIDESVIRMSGRMPGSVYSGDGAPIDSVTGISRLWDDQKFWTKNASRNAEQKTYRGDIELLISGVNAPSSIEFYQFAENYLDKNRYARYVALDNALASGHHDFNHNHKYYFDPFLGKFEPIAWDMDEWQTSANRLDVTGNPLLNAWKLIPEYELLRQRELHKQISAEGMLNLNKILHRIDHYKDMIRPSLAADIYRDTKNFTGIAALKMPAIPLTTFSLKQYDKSIDRLKSGIESRLEFVRGHLQNSILGYRFTPRVGSSALELFTDGNVGRVIDSISFSSLADGARLFRDVNQNGVFDDSDPQVAVSQNGEFQVEEKVLPGFQYVKSDRSPVMLFGNRKLVSAPIRYLYFIADADDTTKLKTIVSRNIVTNDALAFEPRNWKRPEMLEKTASLHPWSLPSQPKPKRIELGPGTVDLEKDLVISAEDSLRVLPGTTLRLGPGVSILSYGQLTFEGTAQQPITVEPREEGKPWGVIAVQGPAANGSRLEFCSVKAGSVYTHNLVYYSGSVSFHGVDNVTLRSCHFSDNKIGDDTVHIGYGNNFLVVDSEFSNGNSDALDVDISRGSILNSRFRASGNDAVDLMTSDVEIDSSLMADSGDKGISVGENSRLKLSNSLLIRNLTSLEIKDQSEVEYGRNMIADSTVGVNLYKKNWRYDNGGIFRAGNLKAIRVEDIIINDKHSTYHVDHVKLALESEVRQYQMRLQDGS